MSKNPDIVISFDTTGSMYPCITEVRRKMTEMVDTLFTKIPDLRMAIIAHGDYCDKNSPYTIMTLDFTSNVANIKHFISSVKNTGGGDADECYELALNTARTLSWREDSVRAFVMIGDCNPHEVGYRYGSYRNDLDWVAEATALSEQGVKIYSCHAMASIRSSSHRFYKRIAEIGNGYYVTLEQFASLPQLLMGICYNENSKSQFIEFAAYIDNANQMTRDLHTSFTAMGAVDLKPMREYARPSPTYTSSPTYKSRPTGTTGSVKVIPTELVPVPASRFQIFNIDKKQDIRSFIGDQHVMFKPGRGFYQLTKSVKVQQHKEIILVDKVTKDMFTGAPARELLGLLPQTMSGGTTQRLSSYDIPKVFDVFIQSTSYNRELLPDTLFMYEMDDWDKDIAVSVPTPAKVVASSKDGKVKATVTGRVPSRPEIARIPAPKKERITPPKDSVLASTDYTAIEARVAESLKKGTLKTELRKAAKGFSFIIPPGTPVCKMHKPYLSDIEKIKFTVVPDSLKEPKAVYLYKLQNPTATWDMVAIHFSYKSGSGARKAAKRFSDWLAASTPVPVKKEEVKPSVKFDSVLDTLTCKNRIVKPVVEEVASMPKNLVKAQKAFEYRVANPGVSWVLVAAHTGFDSGSGARKAANRYEEYLKK